MSKFIIYAKGEILRKNIEKISKNNVIAIADKAALPDEELYGIPVIHPTKLSVYKFDYIIIFSSKWFENIFKELTGTYFVPKEKIISWKTLISEKACLGESVKIVKEMLFNKEVRTILCCEGGLDNYFFLPEELNSNKNIVIDCYAKEKKPFICSLYQNVYESLDLCCKEYDIIIFWKWDKKSFDELIQTISWKYILLVTPYFDKNNNCMWVMLSNLQKYGRTTYYTNVENITWIIEKNTIHPLVKENIHIYVAMHKKYNVLSDDLYMPICIGADYRNKLFLSEEDGENISYLNDKINECTALFWIWKNTNDDIVGLNHYRRYFYNNSIKSNNNYLTKSMISQILSNYDIILPHMTPLYYGTVQEHLESTIPDKKIFCQGLNIIKCMISLKQPDYLDAFNYVMNSNAFFRCNLFVTRREIFDRYCEWLFSFLIDSANEIEISNTDICSKRIIGYFAERMLTVWLVKQKLRIKELPYTDEGDK